MNLKVIKEKSLEQLDIGYFKDTFPSTIEPMVKFKKVSMRKGKKVEKAVIEFYGEAVYLEGSVAVKMLLPLMETTEHGIPLKIRSGDYFMGKMPVILSNPRKVAYQDVVLCDIEYS